MNEFDDELSPHEIDALSKLSKEKLPPHHVEMRTLEALRESQLIRVSFFQRHSRPLLISFVVLVSITFFGLGILLGQRWKSVASIAQTESQFMLLLRNSAQAGQPASATERLQRVKEYSSWAGNMRDQGLLRQGEKLKDEAETLQVMDNQLVVTPSTTEADRNAVAGFFIINARDYQHAVDIARNCPHLKYGGAIEIRQIESTSGRAAQSPSQASLIMTHALQINVDDMKRALDFYVAKLGFEVADRSDYPQRVVLKTDDRIRLILKKVKELQKVQAGDSQVGLTLQVNNLDEAIARMKSLGVEIAEAQPRKEGVGNAIYIRDPFGRKISLMHQTIVKVEPFKEPRIYNFGVLVPDMALGRDFYANKLGFVVRSEKYLPLDLPLGHLDKSFGFMLHYRPGVHATKSEFPRASPYYTIVFETVNLPEALEALTKAGIEIVSKQLPAQGKPGTVVFKDPFGNILELTQVAIHGLHR